MRLHCRYNPAMSDLMRHIAACNNADLPGGRLPFRLDGDAVGWVRPNIADALGRFGARVAGGAVDAAAGELDGLNRQLVDAGWCRWRGEAFDVRATPGGPVLAKADRGVLPTLGLRAVGVHLNGLVRQADGLWLWVARRAMDKLLDPGKFDHLVAGGVPAGLSPEQTLVKEADEEASLPADLVAGARPVAVLEYAMDRAEGLRRDRLHCYDLLLPADFTPEPRDGEVAGFELWPLPAVLDEVRRTDGFKFNVSLVLIDLFLRTGLVQGAEAARLRAALDAPGG